MNTNKDEKGVMKVGLDLGDTLFDRTCPEFPLGKER